ncbi:uncharacterized protein B0I36DRAFT_357123 [Microdochium trichocladiopsis]|uniref:Uncharacterized protein n=1 Tax=Microdochium trichocladiopsis TaxID=1682393 RepID=A0A9P8YGU6_9PEZI|nr:uncharacterized protein B0I36DRAFT_357123 [Microdochium trichocladiopsis]KAH7039728.1 hypothetical protein B0I36DRAFT_357123 [Microdochium trichocladiopsis]
MRPSSTVGLAAVALASVAEARQIFQYINLSVGVTWATITTADGKTHNYGWFLDGCKNTFDFLRETCIDYGRERAHVIFADDGRKICFELTKKDGGSNCSPNRCDHYEYRTYTEVGCSW